MFFLFKHLPPNTHLIRVQPNLACAVQCGVSAFSRGKFALEEDAQLIHKLLLTCGKLILNLSNLEIFKKELKTFLFKLVFE